MTRRWFIVLSLSWCPLVVAGCSSDCPEGTTDTDGRCVAVPRDGGPEEEAGGGEGEGEADAAQLDAGDGGESDGGCEPRVVVYRDADGDGRGETDSEREACVEEAGWVVLAGDCDDSDPEVNFGEEERCDFRDNDCDGLVDNDLQSWVMDSIRLTDDADDALETHIVPVDDGYLMAWSTQVVSGAYEVHSVKLDQNFEVVVPESTTVSDLPDYLYFADLVRNGDSVLLVTFRRRDWAMQSRALVLDQDGGIVNDLVLEFGASELGLEVEAEPTSTGVVAFFTMQDEDSQRRTYVRYWDADAVVTLVGAQFDDMSVRDAAGGPGSDRAAVLLRGELDDQVYVAAVDDEGEELIAPIRLTDAGIFVSADGIATTDRGFLLLYHADGEPITAVALDPDLNIVGTEETNLVAGTSPPDTIACIGADCFVPISQGGQTFGLRFSADAQISGAAVALGERIRGVDVLAELDGYVVSSSVTLVIGEDREVYVDRFGCL